MTTRDLARPLRVAVAGLGAVAQAVHLPLINRRPDLFELVSMYDASPTLRAAVGHRFGVAPSRQYPTFAELLDGPSVDGVMIFTGGSHAGAVIDAFQRGYPVLCEKPLAFTHAEIDKIEAALPDLGVPPLMLGYMKRYDPAVTEAARLLREVGDVQSVEITVLHPTGASQLDVARLVPFARDVAPVDDGPVHRAALGVQGEAINRLYSGALLSSASHDLSLVDLLTGAPTSIDHVDVWNVPARHPRRQVGRDRPALGEQPPSVAVVGRLPGEARMALRWHYLPDYPAYRETVAIHHAHGTFELVFPSPYLLNAPTELTVTDLHHGFERRNTYRSTGEAFELQLEAFHRMVTTGEPPLSSIREGRLTVDLCQQIMRCYAASAGLHLAGEAAPGRDDRRAAIRAVEAEVY